MKKAEYKKSTEDLFEVIRNNSLDSILNEIHNEQIDTTIREYIADFMRERNITTTKDASKRSGISKSYFNEIINGKRKNPSRDMLIQVCFGFEMSLDEAQKFLKAVGIAPLYPRNRRDSIIIHAFDNGLTVAQCNDNLYENGQKLMKW